MAEVHAGETIIPARGSNNFLELVGSIKEMGFGGDTKKLDKLINVNEKNALINKQNRKISFDKYDMAKTTIDYTGFR